MKASEVTQQDVLAIRRFNRFYTQAIGALKRGLLDSMFTLTEGRVLYELATADADATPTASALCEMLDLDASYLSRILRNFEAKNLLSRSASEDDRRVMKLKLTPAGKKAFASLDRASSNDSAALLAKTAPDNRAILLDSMRQIETLLGNAHVGTGTAMRGNANGNLIAARSNAISAQSVEPEVPYRLRAHRPGDIGWVIHRHGALYAQEYGWNEQFEALVAEICSVFIKKFEADREHCWIAEDTDGILGCVFIVKKSATTAKLRLLLVEPRARGMGLGARLVDECIAFARARQYKKLTLWTNDILHAARHIYVARGFKLIKEERHHSFGRDLVGQHWDFKL